MGKVLDEKPKNIAIVGAGLTGLMFALLLDKVGIKATIFESRPEDYRHGGGIIISPNTIRVLDHVGVWEKLRSQVFVYETLALMNPGGSVLGNFVSGREKIHGYPAFRGLRPVLRQAILTEVISRKIPIQYKKKLVSWTETLDDKVNIVFEDGSTAEADLLIGADGIHSTVRQKLFPERHPKYSGVTIIYGGAKRADVEGPDVELTVPSSVFGQEGGVILVPTDPKGQQLNYFANFSLPGRSREEWKSFRSDSEGLHAILEKNLCNGNWPRMIEEIVKKSDIHGHTCWPIFTLPPGEKWSSDSNRVILIGDAAHDISPVTAQGAGMAFEDAETLAFVLAGKDGKIPSDWIEKWEAHRTERLQKVIVYAETLEQRRRPSPNFFLQKLKELVSMAFLKYHGEAGPGSWMFVYDGEEEMKKILG